MARILVVDDEDLVRLTLVQMLEMAGHDVLEANNGQQGVQLCKAHAPELVITDIVMPKMDGTAMIGELRADHPYVAIVAISGCGQTRDVNLLEIPSELNIQGTLAKPFTREQLSNVVRDALAGGGQGARRCMIERTGPAQRSV